MGVEGGIRPTITEQMRRLGTSVRLVARALHDGRRRSPRRCSRPSSVCYEDGLIYRGKRLVNWDPSSARRSRISRSRREEEQGKLWEIRYPLVDGGATERRVVVATTRPETMLGDTAVAVNPDDERYTALIGKQVTLPLTGRTIPIIADAYVDQAFGTGA